MRQLSRIGLLVASFLSLSALSTGCADDEEPKGLYLYVFGPAEDDVIPPELDPFAECDFVKVCYTLEDETKAAACTEAKYLDRAAALKSIPFDERLSVSVECRKSVTDTASGKLTKETTSRGQTCQVRHQKGSSLESRGVYMLPVATFGPTYDMVSERTTNPGTDGRWGAVTVELYDGTILIAGGASLKADEACKSDFAKPSCVSQVSATAVVYDPAEGSFATLPDAGQQMTVKRAFAAAVQLPSEEIAIFGGIDGNGNATDSIDIYNPIDKTFRKATRTNDKGAQVDATMRKSRAFHSATLILAQDGGYVLLVGGYGLGEAYWELWNPRKGSVLEGKLGASRWNHVATLISKEMDPTLPETNGLVIVSGGEDQDGENAGVRDTLEVFDIGAIIDQKDKFVTEQYSLCSNEPAEVKPTPKTLAGAALVPARHFLYVAGGFSDINHATPTRDICVFNYVQRSWSAQTGQFKLGKARGGLTATSMPGNQILFAGGLTAGGTGLVAAETVELLFEYRNDKNELQIAIGPEDTYPIRMLSPRWMHNTIMGCDGKVLVVGGLAGTTVNASTDQTSEVYNPRP